MLPETCSQCGSAYKTCAVCDEKIIFVPGTGFGVAGKYQHIEPPAISKPHLPHPKLFIT